MGTTHITWLESKSRIHIELVALAAILVTLSLLLTSTIRPFTSDDVAQQNIAATLTLDPGRVIDLPQDTFILKLPFYLFLRIFPIAPQVALVSTAIIFNVCGFLLFYWALRSFIRLSEQVHL